MSRRSSYPYWFVAPAAVDYTALFLVPTIASFWFSLTRWDLTTASYIGLGNFRQFFSEPFLVQGLVNTLIYAVLTSGTKTIAGLLIAVLLTWASSARASFAPCYSFRSWFRRSASA